jgi:hypothetical protein
MTGYYDIVLGLIPLSLAGITGILVFAGVSLTTAIPLASIVAVALIGHAMFVSPPTGTAPEPVPEPATSTETTGEAPTNPTK